MQSYNDWIYLCNEYQKENPLRREGANLDKNYLLCLE